MKSFALLKRAPYEEYQVIGIPRALLYYRYGLMWQTFLEEIGRTVVVSCPTDRAILEEGDRLSVDECCLASKIYMGHVASLADCCDAVLVPRYSSFGKHRTFCTKFEALPDLVRNTFALQRPDESLNVISFQIDKNVVDGKERDAFIALGESFGVPAKESKAAYEKASRMQDSMDFHHARVVEDAIAEASGLKILVVAHPYVVHDEYVGEPIVAMLKDMDVTPLFADYVDKKKAFRKSKEFSDTLPWQTNRELVGAILELYSQIDGIVLISAFPCGPDSMADDAIMRYIKGKPILHITVDAQSGTAGLETRVESFVDILRYQRQGGYTHE